MQYDARDAEMYGMHTQSSPVQPPLETTFSDPDFDSVHTFETVQVSKEAPWDKPGEDLLRVWLVTAKREAITHRKRGYKLKHLYKFFGILSIVSAAVVFFIANLSHITDCDESLSSVVSAFVNLLVVNITSFLDYGPKYQRQFEFEGNFTKITIDIEEILSLDREFRAPKDRTLAEYKEKIGNLLVNAPEA